LFVFFTLASYTLFLSFISIWYGVNSFSNSKSLIRPVGHLINGTKCICSRTLVKKANNKKTNKKLIQIFNNCIFNFSLSTAFPLTFPVPFLRVFQALLSFRFICQFLVLIKFFSLFYLFVFLFFAIIHAYHLFIICSLARLIYW